MIKFDTLTSNRGWIEEEVLAFEKIKNKLPEELNYVEIEDGIAIAKPNKEVEFKLNGVINKDILDKINGDLSRIDEYMYNSQKPFSIESVFMNNILIPKDKIIIAPFKELQFKDLFIIPEEFSKDDCWESYVYIGRKKFKTKFIRSAYDGIGVRRYSGDVNNEFIVTLEFFKNSNFQCKIKFNMEKVNSIKDILRIDEYLDNISTLRINSFNLGLKIDKFDGDLFNVVEFWKKVNELGKVLKRRFGYKEEILKRELDIVNDLYRGLIENKFCIHRNQVGTLSFKSKPNGIEQLPVNTPMSIIAIGEREIEILGRKQKLFLEYIFVHYEFKGISDENEENIEVKIDIQSTEKSVVLERYFISEEDRDKVHDEITNGNKKLNEIISLYINDIK